MSKCKVCRKALRDASPKPIEPDEMNLDLAVASTSPAALPRRLPQVGDENHAGMESLDKRFVLCRTACKHFFHKICLDYWFSKKGFKRCPSCQETLNASKMFPVPAHAKFRTRSLPPRSCKKTKCVNIRLNHEKLVTELQQLKEKYAKLEDEKLILMARNASFQYGLDNVKLEKEEHEEDLRYVVGM